MIKKILFILIFFSSSKSYALQELMGRYFFTLRLKKSLSLVTNLDLTLTPKDPRLSYFVIRPLFSFQFSHHWFLDIGPAIKKDFGSSITHNEVRALGDVRYILTVDDFRFKGRVRFEGKWIDQEKDGEMVKSRPFHIRLRGLVQWNDFFNISPRFFIYAGPEFFIEQNTPKNHHMNLGSIRWEGSIGRMISNNFSAQIDIWYRQYIKQDKKDFATLIIRFDHHI